jgi:quercetin dioxygenase-like cupin family protein
MTASRTQGAAVDPSVEALEQLFHADKMKPRWWSNAPGDRYSRHSHPYHKVLFCSRGSIVFHTDEGDIELRPGDRLDVDPGTEHGATVGPEGVTCVEAPLSPEP